MTTPPPPPASASPGREQRLLEGALALGTEAQQQAFLALLDDAALRQRLEELHAASANADSFFGKAPEVHAGLEERDCTEVPPAPNAPAEAPAQMMGRYKLLEKIGEGGFGEVWMAEQRFPVKRRVALKIIKPGMDSRQVVARFEAERQALAMMDHPNIARIFDADVTDSGRPYFVMELVRGIRITKYCDQNQLTTRDRLELFIKVCQAIQHAHQKGIIHRDIMPSNILVTLHDGVPVPKVIDFGIAKATEQEMTDVTLFTQFQQFIGTPAYISPEQAELSGLDIDTRADIYSLGVLLYELLGGQTPFDAKVMMKGGLDALRQIIREREPQRPSTRLNTLQGDERTTAGKRRQTDVGKLMHQLQGDLDWIVMKCLEKDRTRRYDTANGLAMEIQRYLSNEPVVARPPSKAYKIQKAWQRNKLVFTSVALVTLALFAGTGVSTWQAVRANVASHNAQDQQRRAESNERLAVSNAALASDRRGQAERTLQHLQFLLAEQHLSKSEFDRGLALLAVVLRNNPTNVVALRRLTSGLLHRPFHYPAALLTGTSRICEFSPDSRRILIAPGENAVQLWDLRTRQAVGDPMSHGDIVRCAAFSPDGKWIVTGSNDHAARLWDARTGSPVSPPLLHERGITAVAFSPDGAQVATGSEDGKIKFWKSTNGEPARAMLSLASRIRSLH